MKVITGTGTIELGTTEATPTISLVDYSRRTTDAFGVTSVTRRGFSRRLSVKMALPSSEADALQNELADLRATPAVWEADEDLEWLSVEGYYREFEIDLAIPPLSFCSLSVEGLTETEAVADPVGDPAADGETSTLWMIAAEPVTDANLTSTSVVEDEYDDWDSGTLYEAGDRVLKGHRIYENLLSFNQSIDPSTSPNSWLDIGPTNAFAMFDEALGTLTSNASSITIVLTGDVDALALLDVTATSVQVQAGAYDETKSGSSLVFTGIPAGPVTVTITGAGTVTVGTLLQGILLTLGVTEAAPSAGITDYSRKEFDDFGDPVVVERAWAKRMTAKALIRTDAIDLVANRIASVRATPCFWVADGEYQALQVYGFFKEFSIERGETVSKLSLSIEGLSTAAALADLDDFTGIITERYPEPEPTDPPIGSIYFDGNNKPYRFEGRKLFNQDVQLFNGETPLLGSGWVSVRDKGLTEIVDDLQALDDDGKLTVIEKKIAIERDRQLENIYNGVIQQANLLGYDASAVIAARGDYITIRNSIVPAWNDTSQPSDFSGTGWDLVLDIYEKAIADAQADLAAIAGVTVIPPEAETVRLDADGDPVAGQLPRVLEVIVKRGGTDITGDDAVQYEVTSSAGITATVETADGDPDKGEITLTGVTGTGTITLHATVSGIPFGPYTIPITAVDALPFIQNANGIAIPVVLNGVTYWDQMIVGPTSSTKDDVVTLDWPVPFPNVCLHATVGTRLDSQSDTADWMYQEIGAPTTTGITVQLQYFGGGAATQSARPTVRAFGY